MPFRGHYAHMEAAELAPVAALLAKGGIQYGLVATDKTDAIVKAIENMTLPAGVNRDFVIEEILQREAIASTATGQGIAIPHAKNAAALQLPESVLAIAFLAQPVDFDAPDGLPVSTIFLLLSHTPGVHLRLLAHLGRTLQNADIQDALARQLPAETIIELFRRVEPSTDTRRVAAIR